MKRKWAFALTAFCLGSLLLLFFTQRTYQARDNLLRTKERLFTYARASTNYFLVYHTWPSSIQDLFHNPSNVVFVGPETPACDSLGATFDYSPFDPALGFGSVSTRSAGPTTDHGRTNIEARFGRGGITITGMPPVDQSKRRP